MLPCPHTRKGSLLVLHLNEKTLPKTCLGEGSDIEYLAALLRASWNMSTRGKVVQAMEDLRLSRR